MVKIKELHIPIQTEWNLLLLRTNELWPWHRLSKPRRHTMEQRISPARLYHLPRQALASAVPSLAKPHTYPLLGAKELLHFKHETSIAQERAELRRHNLKCTSLGVMLIRVLRREELREKRLVKNKNIPPENTDTSRHFTQIALSLVSSAFWELSRE